MTEEENKYKEEQITRMKSYVVGGIDNSGNIITKMFSKGDEYIVYEIITNELADSVKILIDTQKEDDKVPIERFNEVRQKFTKIKGLLYKVIDDTSIKARIAHILCHAITGKPNEANTQFDELIQEINQDYKDQFNNRLRYLITSIIFMTLCIGFSIYTYTQNKYNDLPLIKQFIYISTASSIGGFLSISRRLKDTIFEKDVNIILYIIYGLERMLIALVAGIVVFFAISCNLIFGFVDSLEKPFWGYLIFAVVAGFSETLLPNLLIKLEKKEK